MKRHQLENKLIEYVLRNRYDDVKRIVLDNENEMNRDWKHKDTFEYHFSRVAPKAELSEEQLAAIEETWGDLYRLGIVNPAWAARYAEVTGTFDPAFVGSDLHFFYTEKETIDFDYLRAFADKSYLDVIFSSAVACPKTLVRKIHGHYLDADFSALTKEEAVDLIFQRKDQGAVVKISRKSSGGHGVFFVDKDTTAQDIEALLRKSADVTVQEALVQHPDMARMNQSSVNTVRVMSIMIDGNSVPVSACVRIGPVGSRVDNASSGGVSCGVNADGSLKPYAYDLEGNRFAQHDSGFVFSTGRVPSFDAIIAISQKLHKRVPMFTVISWDFAVNENADPVLVEINVGKAGIDIHQFNNGPLYGEHREEIIQMVFDDFALQKANADLSYKVFPLQKKASITKATQFLPVFTVPEQVEGVSVTSVQERAFAGNSGLVELVIEPELDSFGRSACSGCEGLRKVQFIKTVKIIRRAGFRGCSSLEEVLFGGSLKTIGSVVFEDCASLKKVVLPKGTKKIGEKAFKGCSNLKELVVPASVTSIGENAFEGCSSLTVHCTKGSAAHRYALEQGIACKTV